MPNPMSRLLRLVALVTLVAASLAALPGSSVAQGLDGDTYTDDVNGWSVTFDDAFWDASELTGSASTGVNLTSDPVLSTLEVRPDGITAPTECLASAEAFYGDALRNNFDVALPETDPSAVGLAYLLSISLDDGSVVDLSLYLECRPLAAATLLVTVATTPDIYLDVLPVIEELLAGIDIGGDSSQGDDEIPEPDDETPEPDDETPEPESTTEEGVLEQGSYVNDAYGLTIGWDPDVWLDAAPLINAEGLIAGYTEPFYSVRAQIRTDLAGTDPSDCLEQLVDDFAGVDGVEDAATPSTFTAPDSDPDAVGQIVSYTYRSGSGEYDAVSYIECRELPGAVLDIQFDGTAVTWEDNIDEMSGFLAGIEIDETPEPDDAETPEPDDAETPGAGGDGDGRLATGMFVSDDYGLTVTWVPDVWVEEEGTPGLGFFLTSRGGESALFVRMDIRPDLDGSDPEACLEQIAGESAAVEITEDFQPAPDLPLPVSDPDAAGGAFTYTIVLADGATIDNASYFECRELAGGAALVVELAAPADGYEDEIDTMTTVLAGIEIDETPEPDDVPDQPVYEPRRPK